MATTVKFDFSGNAPSWLKFKLDAYKKLFSGINDSFFVYAQGDWRHESGTIDTFNRIPAKLEKIGYKFLHLSFVEDDGSNKIITNKYTPVEDGYCEKSPMNSPSIIEIVPKI